MISDDAFKSDSAGPDVRIHSAILPFQGVLLTEIYAQRDHVFVPLYPQALLGLRASSIFNVLHMCITVMP